MAQDVRIEGEDALLETMRKMKVDLQRKLTKQAVRAAGNKTASAARRRVKGPTKKQRAGRGARFLRTGLLAKSMGTKVIGRAGQPNAAAIVGARSTVSGTGYGGKHQPSKISHLVEAGHAGPYPAPPYPFLRPAYDETVKSNIKLMGDKLWAGIRKHGKSS